MLLEPVIKMQTINRPGEPSQNTFTEPVLRASDVKKGCSKM